ncbi:UNKNOWN [Stylonychia lemnae]|uniref:Uncharacterized protein n=1 Tax=Stylonychia lemnae TaxID=5949 RepID=A0A078ARB7_STYLE|nr:UNKNOWN [Stylonychia lemnae]|eukprot:CDW84985.1 UNKNOWN [Stylonychia lemnae]
MIKGYQRLQKLKDTNDLDYSIETYNKVLFGITFGLIIIIGVGYFVYDNYFANPLGSSYQSKISAGRLLTDRSKEYAPVQTLEGSPRQNDSISNRHTSTNEMDTTQKFLRRVHEETKSRVSKNTDSINNEDQGRESLANPMNQNYRRNYA